MSGGNNGSRLKRYSAVKTRIYIADIILTVVILVFFQLVLSLPLSRFTASRFENYYLGCFCYSAVFLLFMYLVSLPLRFYSSFYIEHKFDLSDQPVLLWLKDAAKSLALGFSISGASTLKHNARDTRHQEHFKLHYPHCSSPNEIENRTKLI